MELKIVAYNIHHGRDPTGKASLDRIGEFLRLEAPQLICLNEVDVYKPRSGLIHQPRWLAGYLGMNALFGPTLKFCCIGYGNALLSSFPVKMLANRRLYSLKEPRYTLEVEVTTRGGPMVVICTHLGLESEERKRQVLEIYQRIQEYHDYPVILAGDANALPPELGPIYELLRDAYTYHQGEITGTYPTGPEANRRIDYIFHSGHFEGLWQTHPLIFCSDHLPIVARLDLKIPGY